MRRRALLPCLALLFSVAAPPAAAQAPGFYTVTPCRAFDTRDPAGPYGGPALAPATPRTVTLTSRCSVPAGATAVSLNVTVVNPTPGGTIAIYPAGLPARPPATSLSFSPGPTRANNAMSGLSAAGALVLYSSITTADAPVDVILDVNGYFITPAILLNQPPQVNAGPDATIALPASASLAGSASDDGLPQGSSLAVSWSKVSGPGNVTFGNASSTTTSASFSASGSYVLRLTATDSALAAQDDVAITVNPATPPGPPVSAAEAFRLAEQATWGPTDAVIARIQAIGPAAWIDEQIGTTATGWPVLPLQPEAVPSSCTGTCVRDNYTMYLLQRHFFTKALYSPDQLRQRVAWALYKILVVSGRDVSHPSRLSPYLTILDQRAFGSYRALLSDITLSPAMGRYLDMASSTRTRPNENFAREILQLFSIGTDVLNADGTPQVDAGGVPLPTYDQATVDAFTRVFTGWSFAAQPSPGIVNYTAPLVLNAANHDTTAKTLLSGTTLPAGQTGTVDMNAALDNIFQHPNVGPFIGRQLIQSLVTSNPSPAYVARISAVFANDGTGVRGNLGAMVKAILLDTEARTTPPAALTYGKLKEPVLYVNQILRAFNPRAASGTGPSDGYLAPRTTPMDQDVFRPATVFSYYPPDYLVTGAVEGPEFGILSASTSLARANFVNTIVFSTIGTSTDAPNGTSIDLAPLQALAGNPAQLVDESARRLTGGSLSATARTTIVTAVNAVAASNTLLRARTAVYLVATSSQFQVER